MAERKKSRGRQRIDIKPIPKEEARQVCFTKRRQGLFKKASELCVLCGAEVAVVVFSPAGKLFSYGHPSVEELLCRFFNGKASGPSIAPPSADCGELHRMVTQLTDRVEVEKQRRRELVSARGAPWPGQKPFWWDADPHEMGKEELYEYERFLLQCREGVVGSAGGYGLDRSVADVLMGGNAGVGGGLDVNDMDLHEMGMEELYNERFLLQCREGVVGSAGGYGLAGSVADGPMGGNVGVGGGLEIDDMDVLQPQPIFAMAPMHMHGYQFGDNVYDYFYRF